MNIICLDAEFADNEELLELSMFNAAGEEVYHSYYRPEKDNQLANRYPPYHSRNGEKRAYLCRL